jgi:CheY-like chemotaxis protein
LSKKISVLLLDDNGDVVKLYKKQSEGKGKTFEVTVETDGYRAYRLAFKQLFDLIVIDAKLEYKGYELGGLRLADDLHPRYGSNSILIISRYITQSVLQLYEYNYEFLEKPSGGEGRAFAKEIRSRIQKMRSEQYAFVAMPFADDMSPIFDQIKRGIERSGFKCVRVDGVAHTGSIHELIYDSVRNSKLVIFLADRKNANAYYEAGFADAMKKEVVIIATSVDELMFDVSNRRTITYGSDSDSLPKNMADMINGLRLQVPF